MELKNFSSLQLNFTLEIINNSDTIEIEKHVRFPGVRSEIDIRERTTRGIKLCVSAESGEDPSGSSQVLVALKACWAPAAVAPPSRHTTTERALKIGVSDQWGFSLAPDERKNKSEIF